MKYIVFILIINFLSIQIFAQKKDEKGIEDFIKMSSLIIDEDSVVTIPFDYNKTSIILIKVIINGKEYVFLFDTGASACLISKEIVSQEQILKTITSFDTYGNESKADVVSLNFQLGNAKFSNIATLAGDLRLLTQLGCIKIDGIIGANLINLCNWQINPEKQVISISKLPFQNIHDNSSYDLKLEYTNNGLPLLKLNYDGIDFYSLLDFGCSDFLMLNQDILRKSKKFKKLKSIKGKGLHTISLNSSKEGGLTNITIDTLVSDKFKIANIPTYLDDIKPILGASFFKRYLVSLNPLKKNLILSPLKNEYHNPLLFPIKFGLNNENELIINFIWETEEVKHLGLKIGQKVLSIDNKVFEKLTYSDLCELKNYLTEVSKIKISVQLGKNTREIELFKTLDSK